MSESAPSPSVFEHRVESRDAGERLDKLVARLLSSQGVSRMRVQELCEQQLVQLNARAADSADRVRSGDHIEVQLVPRPAAQLPVAEDIPLVVIYEDEELLVINKPAGLVVHPARGNWTGTLVNAVLHHTRVEEIADDEGTDPTRPGIVHRIDKDTSGLLVIAKTEIARESLREQFAAHTTQRRYVAIVQGLPPSDEQTFSTLYSRHRRDRMKFTSRTTTGKHAVTHMRVVERFVRADVSMVHCRLETGRTHQIRVHLSEHGYPLLGDAMYGRQPKRENVQALAKALGRQALHAQMLGFVHPRSKQLMTFESELPKDMAAILEALRTQTKSTP